MTYSRRIKRLQMRLNEHNVPVVVAPLGCSAQKARHLLYDHYAQIARWLERAIRKRLTAPKSMMVPTPPWPPREQLRQQLEQLAERLKGLSTRFGLPLRTVTFGCQKTQWGSCDSRRRKVILNINLIFLPTHLQDYVLLHELAHLNYPHHQTTFWSFLSWLCGRDAKQLRQELKQYRPKPYQPPSKSYNLFQINKL